MRPDAHTPDVAPCDDCSTTAALVRHTGQWSRCGCGVVFDPVPARLEPQPVERAPDLAAARAAWPGVLRDLAAARLWARAEAARVPGGPADAACLLGRLQGRAGGATRDASDSQVATMWAVLQREGADRARRGFVDALLRHCEETSRPDADATDWAHARRCGERLRALAERGEARLLLAIAFELGEGATWRAGCLLAADVCAPPALRAAWSARAAEERGIVGRPRRDALRPPVDVERAAWGEARLVAPADRRHGSVGSDREALAGAGRLDTRGPRAGWSPDSVQRGAPSAAGLRARTAHGDDARRARSGAVVVLGVRPVVPGTRRWALGAAAGDRRRRRADACRLGGLSAGRGLALRLRRLILPPGAARGAR